MSEPRVAVLTLTRDRLEYTKACFASLRENAGIRYTHYVADQASRDGTQGWLWAQRDIRNANLGSNWGIHKGMNFLLDVIKARGDEYDLLVKVDNDCELLTPGTLKAVAEHVLTKPEEPRVVSPLIHGLRNRPPVIETITAHDTGYLLGVTSAIGGVFMPIPPVFLKAGFRYDETAPVWGGDDERICAMAQEQGGYCGYLLDFEANHYLSTEGQVADKPEYFARRVTEGGPAK